MELPEKLEDAFVAVLQDATWPSDFDTNLILAGESDADKSGQCILCVCGDADQEDPPGSSNTWQMVKVELRTPVLKDASASINAHKAAAAVLSDTIRDDGLKVSLNDAVSDMTIFGIDEIVATREQTETYWMSGFTLHVYACGDDFA